MNRSYIIFLCIFFINIKANQPPEYNLFFNQSQIQKNQVAKLNQNINLKLEKDQDGQNSRVHIIKDLQEFLYFVTKQNVPLIINFYSKSNEYKFEFQELAKKFINKYVFISIDNFKNKQLSQLIFLFLRFDGFNKNPAMIKYPLTLYCKPNSIKVKNGLLNLEKGALKMLLNPGAFNIIKLKSILNR